MKDKHPILEFLLWANPAILFLISAWTWILDGEPRDQIIPVLLGILLLLWDIREGDFRKK